MPDFLPENADPITEKARQVFGISYLYPWQRLVIANILDATAAQHTIDEDGNLRGRQIVLLPTGAGKSLCFQVPALFLDGPTLVIYPLLALMGDQKRRMDEGGLEPVLIRGGQSEEERETLFRKLESRDMSETDAGSADASGTATAKKPPPKLIIANPEVLANARLLDRLAALNISHLAIDEAHCVSEWGDSFRPAYLALGDIIRKLDPPAVTAFTATASPAVLSRISEVLYEGRAHLVRGESDRPNIFWKVYRSAAKEAALVRAVSRSKRPLVIFCSTRGGTERLAIMLRETLSDTDIRFYHAGLQKDEKIEVEAWFHAHERAVLISTCAWGLGVDKKNVRTVIHFNPPPTVEAYVQEAGRGGRDGSPAEAILLWSPEDRKAIYRIKDDATRNRAAVLVSYAEGDQCRRETLLMALGDPHAGPDAPGGQRIACSGCDICNGTAEKETGDVAVVLDFIRNNLRCHTREEAACILCKTGNRVSRENGGFHIWKRSDFTRIIDALVKDGLVREMKNWPWKGKLTAVRPVAGTFIRPRLPVRFLQPWRRKPLAGDVFSAERSSSGNAQHN